MALYPTQDELDNWREGITGAGWTHLNSAGACPVHAKVYEEMVNFLDLERTIGGYEAVEQRKQSKGMDARVALAKLLACEKEEIALGESAQVGWAKAFYSMDFRQGDRIICWKSEYAVSGML